MTSADTSEHYTVISADTHAGGSHAMYREYLEEKYLDDFDAWRGEYKNPFSDLGDERRLRNWDDEMRTRQQDEDGVAGPRGELLVADAQAAGAGEPGRLPVQGDVLGLRPPPLAAVADRAHVIDRCGNDEARFAASTERLDGQVHLAQPLPVRGVVGPISHVLQAPQAR